MTSNFRSKVFLAVLLTAIMAVYCSENENIPAAPSVALSIEIIAGPASGSTVLNDASFTFVWRVNGSGGSTFTYQLTGVDASAMTTTDFSKSYPGQLAGSYTFTITAAAGGESSSDTRTFTVGGSLFDPSATVSGPRGSASSGGSGIIPDYAPGSPVKLSWVGSDEDRFGTIAGYTFKTTDAGSFSTSSLGTAITFDAPSAVGSYTFTLVVTDNTVATTTVTYRYNVKTPEILIVDDRDLSDFLDELADDRYFADLFDGFSFETVDFATDGFSAPGEAIKIVVWHGGDSREWREMRRGNTTVLADFIDGGGKLWAMGQRLAEDTNVNNPPLADDFNAKYLHVSTTDGATQRAGDFSGTTAFSFAIDALSNPGDYPKIKMGSLASGDVDQVFAGDDAEIVYTGTDGLDVPVGNVALRWPAGNTGTKLFYMTFPLLDTGTNFVSPAAAKILVNTIMIAMGQ